MTVELRATTKRSQIVGKNLLRAYHYESASVGLRVIQVAAGQAEQTGLLEIKS